MKTVRSKLHKTVIIIFLAVAFPAFFMGWVVAVNFSGVFETGYKMAFLDIKAAIREAMKDGQQHFYMQGIKFCPGKDDADGSTTVAVVEKGRNRENGRDPFRISYNVDNYR